MNAFARALIFTAVLLEGCRATRDVAVTSYHVTRGVAVGSYRVATAPAHYVLRRHSGEPSTTTTAMTETTSSDVNTPGQPVPPRELASAQQRPANERIPSSSATAVPRRTRKETAEVKPRPSPPAHAASTQLQFPTAKPVPGKPGYVLSPFDPNGRYVDVSGYTPGSKVKDPWTDKIFIVP